MPGSKKRPSDDIDNDNSATDPQAMLHIRRQNKTARSGQTADAPTAVNALQRAAPTAHTNSTSLVAGPTAHPDTNKENDTLAASNRRSARTNRGKGGHVTQLQKAVQNIRPDLDPNTGSKKQTTLRHGVGSFPSSVPENEMAPPQRQQKKIASTAPKTAYKRPIRPDPPLQLTPPAPTLQLSLPGSQYGLSIQARNTRIESESPQPVQNSAISNIPQAPRNNFLRTNTYPQSNNFNANNSSIPTRNNLPQMQDPRSTHNEIVFEAQSDHEDDLEDFYDEEAGNYPTEEGSQERNEDIQPSAFSNEDAHMDDLFDNEIDTNINPAKFYFKEGVGLIPIDSPEAGTQDDNYIASPIINGAGELPFGFDEASPSEDEAVALAALHRQSSADPEPAGATVESDYEDNIQDVLQEHRRRNRANRAPCPQRLRLCAEKQSSGRNPRHQNADENMDTDDLEDVSAEESAEESADQGTIKEKGGSKKRTRSTPAVPKPTTLAGYPGDWKAALTCGKRLWQRYIIIDSDDPFPEREPHLPAARKILKDIISQRHSDGEIFNPLEHTRNMDIVIFQEGATFRGRLKTLAVGVVETQFKDILNPDTSDIPGQRDVQLVKERSIKSILDVFHQHGLDENLRTNNIAHPSIPELIHKFFYGGNDSLAALYPKDFSVKVPEKAIALVMTCIKNVLDEWNVTCEERTPISFTGERYRPVFTGMQLAIDKVKSDPYHREKYEMNHARWAEAGMLSLQKDKLAIAKTYSVKVALD